MCYNKLYNMHSAVQHSSKKGWPKPSFDPQVLGLAGFVLMSIIALTCVLINEYSYRILLRPANDFLDPIAYFSWSSFPSALYGVLGIFLLLRVINDKVKIWPHFFGYYLVAWMLGIFSTIIGPAIGWVWAFVPGRCGFQCVNIRPIIFLIWFVVPFFFWLIALKAHADR